MNIFIHCIYLFPNFNSEYKTNSILIMQNSTILFATIQTILFVAFAFNYIKLIHSLIKKH